MTTPFGMGPPGAPDLGALLQRLGRMMSSGSAGPVDWTGAERTALDTIRRLDHPLVSAEDERDVLSVMTTAQVWLDEACALPALTTGARAWTPTQWLTGTLPAWRVIIEPVAAKVSAGTTDLFTGSDLAELGFAPPGLPGLGGGDLPPGAAEQMNGMLAVLMSALRPLAAVMFGAQVGQALGQMSGEVMSGGDIGLSITADHVPTLIPFGIERFGAGLDVEPLQIVHYVAVREAARERLFTAAPWLTARTRDAMAEYAGGLTVDVAAIREALTSIDPGRPEMMAEALGSGLLQPQVTPAQQALLVRIETLIALAEGWCDVVVAKAAGDRLPALPRLTEAMRRRRAAGGPAEKAFRALVGLELRPRRLREAARLWSLIGHAQGDTARDELWRHPDLVPDAADLDDPDAFLAGLGRA